MTIDKMNFASPDDSARRADALYQSDIRAKVETAENIGKMVIIDLDTGDFAVDELGFDSANALRKKNPRADLFGIRVGYKVAATLGGVMERTEPLIEGAK